MTKGSKIMASVAGALAAGLVINYILNTEKGSEVRQHLKNAAGGLFDKGKEILGKAKNEADSKLRENNFLS